MVKQVGGEKMSGLQVEIARQNAKGQGVYKLGDISVCDGGAVIPGQVPAEKLPEYQLLP